MSQPVGADEDKGHLGRDLYNGNGIFGVFVWFQINIKTDNCLKTCFIAMETVSQRTVEQHSYVIQLICKIDFVGKQIRSVRSE